MRLRPEFPCETPDELAMRLRLWWLRVDRTKAAAAALGRQAFPIVAYVGSNGGGKSLAAVYDVLPVLAGHERYAAECTIEDHPCFGTVVQRRVISTVRLTTPEGEDHPLWVPLTSFPVMLAEAYHAEVILDEVTGVADAQDHQSLPTQVRNLVAQLRRRDVRLRWTTPDFSGANVRIRQVTQAVVYCSGHAKVVSSAQGVVWRQARTFRWATYDAAGFDDFTAHRRQSISPEGVQQFYRPGHLAEKSYDTMASVLAVGVAAEGGMCLTCGGNRSRPRCGCAPDPEFLPPGVVEIEERSGRRRMTVERAAALGHSVVARA